MSRLPLPVIELTSRPVGPDVVHASRNAERIGFGGATLGVFILTPIRSSWQDRSVGLDHAIRKWRDGLLRPVPAHPSASET